MKEFDNTSIERLAKTEVDEYFAYSGFVRPYITENDKTPAWDGNLFVYSKKREMNNETLRFKVPLQLKGEEYSEESFPEKTYYQISFNELSLYQNDGGVLFIKVLIHGRAKKIYYSFLTKHKLGAYIKSMSGKSRSVKLLPLSDDILEFINEASSFHLQQKNTPISPMDLKDKVFQIRCDAPKLKGENDYAFIIRNQKQLIIKVDGLDGEFYLDCENVNLKTPIKENRIVSVNDTEYYSTITRVYEPNRVQALYIGKSLLIRIVPVEQGVNINFSLTLKASNLDELLHELRFLVALGTYKRLTMDGVTIDMPQLNNENNIFDRWQRSLKLWEDANTLFQILNVYEELDINSMEDEDYDNLEKLIQAILYNKALTTKIKHDHLERTKVGNLNIIMLVRLIGKKNCKLESVQNSLLSVSKEDDGKLYPLPIISKILREKPLQSNINFEGILDEYNKFYPINPSLLETANEDVLLFLTHYDDKKSSILIKMANNLCNWLLSKDENPIYFLNHLQIKYRLGENYNDEERERLYGISEENSSYTNRWAACIILGEYSRAQRYWEKMNFNDKKIYVQYPIFMLVPENLRKSYLDDITVLEQSLEGEKKKLIC